VKRRMAHMVPELPGFLSSFSAGYPLREVVFMFSWRRTPGSGPSDQRDQSPAFGHLLDRARLGESEAMSALYQQFLPGVFGYIAARVPDRAIAEDLTSEVFLKMVEGISRLRASDEAGFAAWILQIARVTVATYYRKSEKQLTCIPLEPTSWEEEEGKESWEIPADHPDADPVRQAEAREEWNTVVKAINTLTEEQRQVLIARLILGYDVATVARMIGKNTNAVKALQFRALHALHRLLGQETLPEQAFYVHARHHGGAL
jgi:RNA polymerase sigma-70 factor (ECF subfamily)